MRVFMHNLKVPWIELPSIQPEFMRIDQNTPDNKERASNEHHNRDQPQHNGRCTRRG